MILYLHKATQKPSWGSLDETDSAITTTELTEKKSYSSKPEPYQM